MGDVTRRKQRPAATAGRCRRRGDPAGAPRPRLRVRRARRRWPTTPCREPGCGCASPAATSTASSSSAASQAEHDGRLAPLRRVVSARAGADARGAGPVPRGRRPLRRHARRRAAPGRAQAPRHGRAQPRARSAPRPDARRRAPDPRTVGGLPGRAGVPAPASPRGRARPPRGPPCRDARAARTGRRALAVAAATALAAGRGALVVVPDHRDVDRLDAALTERARHGPARAAHRRPGPTGALHRVAQGAARPRPGASSAPGRRPSRPCTTSGSSPGGTTATTCSPSRARPTPTSATCSGCARPRPGAALLTGGFGRSLRVQVRRRGRARSCPVEADAATLRAAAPRVTIAGEGVDEERDGPAARGPHPVARLAGRQGRASSTARCSSRCRAAATSRRLSCAECRSPVRCARCQGPMALGPPARPRPAAGAGWRCRPHGFECGHCGVAPAALVGRRRPAHGRGDRPRLPGRRRCTRRAPARCWPPSAARARARHRHARGRAGGRGRLRRACCCSTRGRASTCRCSTRRSRRCAAGWPRAALARDGARRRAVRRPRGGRAAGRRGAGALGPGLARRPRAGRAGRARPAAGGAGGPADRRPARPSRRRSGRPTCRRAAQVLGPVPLSHTGTAPGRRPAAGSDADRPPADHHVLVRVPAAETASLTRALLALKAFRSARKEADVVAIRIDPLDTF